MQLKQRERLRVMNDNQVIFPLEELCNPGRIRDIHFSFIGFQFVLGSLEAIVDELGDFEEVRVSPDDAPIRRQAQVPHRHCRPSLRWSVRNRSLRVGDDAADFLSRLLRRQPNEHWGSDRHLASSG